MNELGQYEVYFPHIDQTRLFLLKFLEFEVEVERQQCTKCENLEFHTQTVYLNGNDVSIAGVVASSIEQAFGDA